MDNVRRNCIAIHLQYYLNMNIGPPPKPQSNYGPPKPSFYPAPTNLKPFYSLPNKPAVNFKPPQQQQQPQAIYGGPQASQSVRQPVQAYGPPKQPLIHGAGCDGWKPIPNPHPIQQHQQNLQSDPHTITIQTQTITANSNQAPIQTDLVENTYLPPPSNNLALADNINLNVQPLPTNLQLPIDEASRFHDDSGLGLTNINIVKTDGFEVCNNNFIDGGLFMPDGM